MKKSPMIVGMLLATAMVAWADEIALPKEAEKTPPATIAWGEAVDGVQVGLVPLGGAKGDGWGEAQNLFFCPKCANKPRKHCMAPSSAAAGRVCAVCQTPKPWSATFVERTPMRMELHVRNLAKEERSLYDARYFGQWRFTFTPVGGGTSWQGSWNGIVEKTRTVVALAESTIKLAAGQQNAFELELAPGLRFSDRQGRQPAIRTLPAGKYSVTASYTHPEHEQAKPCTYWHGTVTTGPVEIEIKAGAPAADAQDKAGQKAADKAQLEKVATASFIIPRGQQAILETGAWTPSPEQAKKAMEAVHRYLKTEQGTKRDPAGYSVPDAEKQIVEKGGKYYCVQFIGEDKKGKRLIRCLFFPNREGDPNWKTKEYRYGRDGGISYWGIRYDPEKNDCLDFWTNGEA